jgi:glycosyltransferase involved in cell wall biosynthesis
MKKSETENRKPKVVHIIWWIPHYRSGVFQKLCNSCSMDFTIVAGDNSEVTKGVKIDSAEDAGKLENIKWRKVLSRHLKGPLFKGWEWQPETVKMVLKEDIDAVIALGSVKSLSNWLVALICRLRGIPYIDWSIGVMGPEKKLKWWIRKCYLKLAKAHLLYGSWARNWYLEHGFKNEQMFLVHNSLNYSEQVVIRNRITEKDIQLIRERFNVIGQQDRLLFHSGRLEQKKNLDLLFDALKTMKQGRKIVRLVIIGKGNDEKRLKDLVREKGIEDLVIFYGVCYDEEELAKIISASDLCVVPGVTGLIAMHSFVYGTPILTRDNSAWLHGPEVEAVIEGKTGQIFRDGDIKDLVEKMNEMLYPIPCKSQMSENCRKIIDSEYNPFYQERVVIQALNYVLPPEKQIPLPEK